MVPLPWGGCCIVGGYWHEKLEATDYQDDVDLYCTGNRRWCIWKGRWIDNEYMLNGRSRFLIIPVPDNWTVCDNDNFTIHGGPRPSTSGCQKMKSFQGFFAVAFLMFLGK